MQSGLSKRNYSQFIPSRVTLPGRVRDGYVHSGVKGGGGSAVKVPPVPHK